MKNHEKPNLTTLKILEYSLPPDDSVMLGSKYLDTFASSLALIIQGIQ